MTIELHHGDCLDVMATLEANSIDTVITDAPAGIAFMGKKWDNKTGYVAKTDKGMQFLECGELLGLEPWETGFVAFMIDVLLSTYRVMKPGATCLIWALPRTADLTGMAMRVAGLEIRDILTHLFGGGFPKSANISKNIDKQEQNRWNKISKAVDNLDISAIIEVWKKYSSNVKLAGEISEKSRIETGTNTQKNGFALVPVVLSVNPEKSNASVIIAELSSSEARHTPEAITLSAQDGVEAITGQLNESAMFAERPSGEQRATLSTGESGSRTRAFTALCDVRGLLNENITDKTKGVEVLRILIGSTKSSRLENTHALCVALTDDLKHIILNQSRTFQSLDTIQQMGFASATSVTITESTAALLISSTADTLKKYALDRAAGVEREVIGSYSDNGRKCPKHQNTHAKWEGAAVVDITAPATDAAKLFAGYHSGLKPAAEFWLLGMKPIESTFASNAITWGVAGLNIDGSRIPGVPESTRYDPEKHSHDGYRMTATGQETAMTAQGKQGRFPSNLILSHHPECRRIGTRKVKSHNSDNKETGAARQGNCYGEYAGRVNGGYASPDGTETIPAYDCHPECPIFLLGQQSGMQTDRPAKKALTGEGSGSGEKPPTKNAYGNGILSLATTGYQTAGTAARYFLNLEGETRFIYQAKASKRERNDGLDDFYWCKDKSVPFGFVRVTLDEWNALPEKERAQGNVHATVKSRALMAYLCKLTRTPTGGTVLDFCMGSGSTGLGCIDTDRDFIGIERDIESFEISQARIEHVQNKIEQLSF